LLFVFRVVVNWSRWRFLSSLGVSWFKS